MSNIKLHADNGSRPDTWYHIFFVVDFIRTASSNLPQWHNESTWPLGVGTGYGEGISWACPSHALLTRESPSCGHWSSDQRPHCQGHPVWGWGNWSALSADLKTIVRQNIGNVIQGKKIQIQYMYIVCPWWHMYHYTCTLPWMCWRKHIYTDSGCGSASVVEYSSASSVRKTWLKTERQIQVMLVEH